MAVLARRECKDMLHSLFIVHFVGNSGDHSVTILQSSTCPQLVTEKTDLHFPISLSLTECYFYVVVYDIVYGEVGGQWEDLQGDEYYTVSLNIKPCQGATKT